MRPQLFRSRDDASITLLQEAGEGQFQAARIEGGIFRDALSLMKNDNGARSGFAHNSAGHLRGIALHGIEPANRPSDQHEPPAFELRVNKNIFQTGGCSKIMGRPIRAGAEKLRAKIDFRRDSSWSRGPKRRARM